MMRIAAVGLLLVCVIGATLAGIRLGGDALAHPHNDIWAAFAGLTIASAVLMAVSATTFSPRPSGMAGLALAPTASVISANLISGGFWISVILVAPDSCVEHTISNPNTTCFYTGSYVVLWAFFSAVMAIVGAAAWGLTRIIPPAAKLRAAASLLLVSIIGATVLGVVLALDTWPDNNKFWHQFLGMGAGGAVLMAAASLALPGGDRRLQINAGVGLLIVLVVGATALGVLVGQDLIRAEGEESGTAAWALFLWLIMANAALMAVFAATVPAAGPAVRRFSLAVVAPAASASLVAGGLWIGAWVPEAETYRGEGSFAYFPIGAYFFFWALTAAITAVAGAIAWGVARALVWVTSR